MKLPDKYPKINDLVYLTPQVIHFEVAYLEARIKEGRLYPDEVVRQLPYLPPEHPQAREWGLRQHNVHQLLGLLKKHPKFCILDLGCGNGWLLHALSRDLPDCRLHGADLNRVELQQASRLFTHDRMRWYYVDLLKESYSPELKYDVIIFRHCKELQYPQLLVLGILGGC